MPSVPDSQKDAVDLFRKWLDEDYVVHGTIWPGPQWPRGLLAQLLSKIDEVADSRVRLSMKKTGAPLGSTVLQMLTCTALYSRSVPLKTLKNRYAQGS